jgi:dCTP deaminase
MVSHDPTVGELRIHYAGFFDPGFGDRSDERRGTRAVLEVRCRDVPFLLRDGQRIGRLTYERLIGTPRAAYGVAIGSSYQGQNVTLSKQFRESRTHRA